MTSNNVCNTTAYTNFIDQKTRFQLNNIPSQRYNNLANNPYLQINRNTGKLYTKNDVDMRRKAEILKYKSNRMSTQTNNLTKAQQYSQSVHNAKNRKYTQQFIDDNTENGVLQVCPTTIIQTPSTASDVPGKSIILYDDPSVPLYNLVNTTNTPYAIINQELNPYPDGYTYKNNINIINNQIVPSKICTLYFFNSPSNYYNLSFSTSISLSFVSKTLNTTFAGINYFNLSINTISLAILYSSSNVKLKTILPIYPNGFSNNIIVSKQDTVFDLNNKSLNDFNGLFYLCTATFNNIELPVSLGYIYDIQLNVTYNIIPSNAYSQNYSPPVITTFLNSNGPSTATLNNCNITGNLSPPSKFIPFTISGKPV